MIIVGYVTFMVTASRYVCTYNLFIAHSVSWHNGMALSNGSSLLIARRSVDEFDVLSSEDLQASNCTKLVDYSELVAMEVKENWESLEQHLDPMYKLQFFNSSFSKNNKVKRNQALVDNADQWFSQYVSWYSKPNLSSAIFCACKRLWISSGECKIALVYMSILVCPSALAQ